MKKLKKEYRRIKKEHRKAILLRLARSAIGSSVGRVFKKGSKKQICHKLGQIRVDEILCLRNEQDYKKWFEKQLNVLAQIIKKTNKGSKLLRVHTRSICRYRLRLPASGG